MRLEAMIPVKRSTLLVAATFSAVVLAVEPRLTTFLETYTRNEDYLLFSIQNDRVRDPSATAEVIFLGDSTLRSTLIPRVFEAESGARALNLATVSNAGLMSDLYLLERYLEHHPPPKVVVLSHALGVFQLDLHEHLYQVHFATPARTLELASARLLPPLSAVDALLASSLDSYRHRPYLRTLFDGLLAADLESLRLGRVENANFRAARRALGWYPDERRFEPVPGARPAELSAPFSVSPSATWFMSRLLELAERHRIRMLWAHSALYAEYLPHLEEAGFLEAHRRHLSDIAEQSTFFAVLEAEIPGLAAEALATVNHPRPESAEWLTKRWAERLRPVLAE